MSFLHRNFAATFPCGLRADDNSAVFSARHRPGEASLQPSRWRRPGDRTSVSSTQAVAAPLWLRPGGATPLCASDAAAAASSLLPLLTSPSDSPPLDKTSLDGPLLFLLLALFCSYDDHSCYYHYHSTEPEPKLVPTERTTIHSSHMSTPRGVPAAATRAIAWRPHICLEHASRRRHVCRVSEPSDQDPLCFTTHSHSRPAENSRINLQSGSIVFYDR